MARALAEVSWRSQRITDVWVVFSQSDGSGAAHFEEGLAWNSSGEYAVSRKSLREMVDDSVIGLRT
jgi:hypothetical protein